jgi:hypothetical protein
MKNRQKKLEISKQGRNIVVTNISPVLSSEKLVKKIENEMLIESVSNSIKFDEYVKKAEYCDPFAVTFKPGCNKYQALIITSDGSNSFDKSLSEIKRLGYSEATLMDCLHIWSLSDKSIQGYKNNLGIPVSQLVQYLVAPGTRTDAEKVQWSCLPRLEIKERLLLDFIPWRALEHYSDHGLVGIKEIS